jgi:hypothetical protein
MNSLKISLSKNLKYVLILFNLHEIDTFHLFCMTIDTSIKNTIGVGKKEPLPRNLLEDDNKLSYM